MKRIRTAGVLLLGACSLHGTMAHAAEEWWSAFDDPLLSEAIETALNSNVDLATARALQKRSGAAVFQQASGNLPQVSIGVNSNWSPTESLGFGIGYTMPGAVELPKTFMSGQANLQASWNVDLFGQNASLVYAADRDAKAALHDVQTQELNVAIQVTEAYWDAVVADRFLALAEDQVKVQEGLLEALTLRYSDSDVGALDVLQQRQQVASVKVQVPQRRIQRRVSKQRLAVLLGLEPDAAVNVASQLPASPEPLGSAAFDAALMQRPDILAADRRVQSAKSRQWSAWASALPQVGVSAQTGFQFRDMGDLDAQRVWGAGTTLTIPLFSGGRTYGGIRGARAGVMEAEARLRSAKLNAAQQSQGAWVRDSEQQALLQALSAQYEAAEQAWSLAREQVVQGTLPYLNAQAVLTRKQQAELALLQGQRDAFSARITLIQSLGGLSPREGSP